MVLVSGPTLLNFLVLYDLTSPLVNNIRVKSRISWLRKTMTRGLNMLVKQGTPTNERYTYPYLARFVLERMKLMVDMQYGMFMRRMIQQLLVLVSLTLLFENILPIVRSEATIPSMH